MDPTKARTYNLKVEAKIPLTAIKASQTFKVIFWDVCDNAIIQPSSLIDQSYTIGDPILSV